MCGQLRSHYLLFDAIESENRLPSVRDSFRAALGLLSQAPIIGWPIPDERHTHPGSVNQHALIVSLPHQSMHNDSPTGWE